MYMPCKSVFSAVRHDKVVVGPNVLQDDVHTLSDPQVDVARPEGIQLAVEGPVELAVLGTVGQVAEAVLGHGLADYEQLVREGDIAFALGVIVSGDNCHFLSLGVRGKGFLSSMASN